MRSPGWASGLRVAALLALVLPFAILLSEIEDAVLGVADPSAGRAALAGLATLGVGAAIAAVLRVLRPRAAGPDWDGFAARPGGARRLALGAGTGLVMLGAVAVLGIGLGLYRVEGVAPLDADAAAVLGFGAAAALAGAYLEEAVFRGGLYGEARRRMGFWAAALLVGSPFALAHLATPGFGVPFAASALMVSVLLAATREITGDLWFALGWHAAWNAAQYALIGIAVADAPFDGHALVQIERAGSDLWLGRGQGIEGGLLAGGVLAVAFLAALALRRSRRRAA